MKDALPELEDGLRGETLPEGEEGWDEGTLPESETGVVGREPGPEGTPTEEAGETGGAVGATGAVAAAGVPRGRTDGAGED